MKIASGQSDNPIVYMERTMRTNQQILAVQIGAPCYVECGFCRTPKHELGDLEATFRAVEARLDGVSKVYATSTGETGLSPIFGRIVELVQGHGIKLSVLCATAESVVPALGHVEVSVNKYTKALAMETIQKARDLSIPTALSIVDSGKTPDDLEGLANEFGVDAVLQRALRKEGRSRRTSGISRFWKRSGIDMGAFPIAAYGELQDAGLGHPATCIDHFGNEVPMLGSPVH